MNSIFLDVVPLWRNTMLEELCTEGPGIQQQPPNKARSFRAVVEDMVEMDGTAGGICKRVIREGIGSVLGIVEYESILIDYSAYVDNVELPIKWTVFPETVSVDFANAVPPLKVMLMSMKVQEQAQFLVAPRYIEALITKGFLNEVKPHGEIVLFEMEVKQSFKGGQSVLTNFITLGLSSLVQPKLKTTAVPSLKLPQKKSRKQILAIDRRRYERIERRNMLREVSSNIVLASELPVDNEQFIRDADQNPVVLNALAPEEQVAIQSLLNLHDKVCFKLQNKSTQVTSGDLLTTFASTIKSDSHLNSLTGIPSLTLLHELTKLITKFYPDKRSHKLTCEERIILVFMKLKIGIKFIVLAFLFRVSQATIRNIFDEYISYLSNILNACITWPSAEECRANLPRCFENFKCVRIVLDCTEIALQKPACLCCRIRTYSHYKGGHTLKVMIGVSPAALITFISKCYGGRTSDKCIFIQSGLIKKLNPNTDSVMVDKGFLIEDVCSSYCIKIVRPSFLRKQKQFTEQEANLNILISKARVHIERVNQRLKIFEILKHPFPWTLVPKIDDILIVICAMVNLQTPVLLDDKF